MTNSSSNKNEFGNGLGIILGITGALLGYSAAQEDPEITNGIGTIVGFLMGYIGGHIAAAVLSIVFKTIIALLGIAIILLRVGNFLNLFSA